MTKSIPGAYCDEPQEVSLGRAARTNISLRSLLAGLGLACCVGALGPLISLQIKGSNAGAFFASPLSVCILLLFVAAFNPLLARRRPSWRLGRDELVVCFVMMTLANAAGTMVNYWVPAVANPLYYGSTDAEWQLLWPHIRSWTVAGARGAAVAFFEGTGESGSIDWSIWAAPLIGWAPLFIALPTAMICLMVIVRRRWVEQERLIYPVMQLPLALVRDVGASLWPPLFRSRAMWIGAAVPVVVGLINGLHAYDPGIPRIDLAFTIPPYPSSRLSFATLGVFFLLPREVLLGLWLFAALGNLQHDLYRDIGLGPGSDPTIGVWSYGPHSIVYQSMGAMVVLVLGILWAGRGHLKQVVAKAVSNRTEADDSDEILSYRAALLGWVGAVAVLFAWLWGIGIPPLGAAIFLVFAFTVYLAITRVVVEGGVAVFYTPLVASEAALSAVGTSVYGPSGIAGLLFTRVFCNDLLNFPMPHIAHGLRLIGPVGERRRLLFWGLLLAILAGMASGLWMVLKLAHVHGAINLSNVHFVSLATWVSDYAADRIRNPSGPSALGWTHGGIGGLVMLLLLLARQKVPWWPLHPIGFPISSTFRWMAFNALLAWLIRLPVQRFGGAAAYRATVPFFIGLVLGQFAAYGLFWIVDAITGKVGNRLPL